MRVVIVLSLLLVGAAPAAAWDFNNTVDFGRVIAAEPFCDLTYDQASIAAWVTENVPADQADFPGLLDAAITGATFEQQGMGASQKTAHCVQITRLAEAYGFTG